jgi:cyclopropane fatty-acyl-phospholipid synthase-like methyltransferase
VAIAKARARVSQDAHKPELFAADVRDLSFLSGQFDSSFDVGCFHCLNATQQAAYVAQLATLLRPGASHLIWALDSSPSGQQLSAAVVADRFAPAFALVSAEKSRRRLAASHWYWLRHHAG